MRINSFQVVIKKAPSQTFTTDDSPVNSSG